jgi:tripeptide aminopeptidase
MLTHGARINRQRLLERFLRYVQIATPADPQSETYPSSSGQVVLGKLLVAELQRMGAADAHQDAHALVWANIPATVSHPCATVLLNAHLDTSPEAPADNIKPQVIRDYDGGEICLAGSGAILSPTNTAELTQLAGHTLVTTDGNTLLGGDDKAGVAAIMELAEHLLENPQLAHGPIRVLFTCDEEIGNGAQYVNFAKANSDVAYTLDAGGLGDVENETFSADLLTVMVQGYNIHPAIAKGKMINAIRGLAMLLAELPKDQMSPESTADRDGFLHPYQISGGVGEARADILLRDFDSARLDHYADLVQQLADRVCQQLPGLKISIDRQQQYRNMAQWLADFPEAVDYAILAHQQLGRSARLSSIRGGTDGAHFSANGLPTPNLSVGQHNIHSVLEFVSLDEISYAVQHAILMLELWAKHSAC